MGVSNYWTDRIKRITGELVHERAQLSATTIESDWQAFMPGAMKELANAYAWFCNAIRYRVRARMLFGLHTLSGAGILHDHLVKHGRFSLIAYAGEYQTSSCVTVFPAQEGRWGYTATQLVLRGRKPAEAFLSFDFNKIDSFLSATQRAFDRSVNSTIKSRPGQNHGPSRTSRRPRLPRLRASTLS